MKFDNGIMMHGDCLELMKKIPDNYVDMILCDLPYGTTECSWDTIIPFEPLWEQYWRILKPNRAIVLTASQPFTTALIMSDISNFKYEWIWQKNRPTNFVNAKNKPMKKHENVLVFSQGTTVHATQSKNRMPYNPQGLISIETKKVTKKLSEKTDTFFPNRPGHKEFERNVTGFPHSLLEFSTDQLGIHPTAKPVALFEYLIKTYTNENQIVLDNCIGSGTTAIASINTNRKFIGMEMDKKYYDIACERILKHQQEKINKEETN